MSIKILNEIASERAALTKSFLSFRELKKENICYEEYDTVSTITREMIELSEEGILKNCPESELLQKCGALRSQAELLKGFCNA